MIVYSSVFGFVVPIVVFYLIIAVIADLRNKKKKEELPVSIPTVNKVIDKESFLEENDRKIAEHSESIEPVRMERVSLHVERLSEKRKPIAKVKETILNEEVVKREVIHEKIDVKNMFTCRDDMVKGMIYKEVLSKPKGLR